MPRNPLLFPNKFVLDGTTSNSGISALEIAVNNLSVASKSGAMRQANAIRQSGLNSIKNQNRNMPTLNSLLPTRSVGRYVLPLSIPTGTKGYILSGYLLPSGSPEYYDMTVRRDRFTFATDTMVGIGNSEPGIHAGFEVANAENGYFAWFNGFWRMNFQTETTTPMGLFVFPSRYQGASLKTPSRGYFCDGSNRLGSVDRFSFAGEVCVSIGSRLQGRNYMSSCGNKFNGYIAGGDTSSTLATSNIERFSYAAETKVDIVAALSTRKRLISPWVPGSTNAAYLMGGYASGPFPTAGSTERLYISKTIDKFSFTGETITVIGSELTNGICSHGAIGSPSRVVIAGGQSHPDAYTVQASTVQVSRVTALTFATELNTVLGATLSKERFIPISLDNSSF